MATKNVIETLILPVLDSMGYRLWGIEWAPSQGNATLRVYVENNQDTGVSIDECALISRRLSTILDVEMPTQSAYVLEVSSPGLNRPLFTLAQMIRFVGHDLQIRLKNQPEGARKQYKGTLLHINNTELQVKGETEEYSLSFNDIDYARLIPNFSHAFKKTKEAKHNE
jgi:ribosome maturation factor RimP